jgi:hypothetical protein
LYRWQDGVDEKEVWTGKIGVAVVQAIVDYNIRLTLLIEKVEKEPETTPLFPLELEKGAWQQENWLTDRIC